MNDEVIARNAGETKQEMAARVECEHSDGCHWLLVDFVAAEAALSKVGGLA